MNILAVVAGALPTAPPTPAAETASPGLEINLFWIIVAALSFVLFLNLIGRFGFDSIEKMLAERRTRIEEGLRDAEQARKDRETAESERARIVQDARREASDLLARAQKSAQELRDADIAATREELERIRERAAADIDAERQRALADLRAQVADLALAAAGKVVGETMTDARQRRLVEQFLSETRPGSGDGRGA